MRISIIRYMKMIKMTCLLACGMMGMIFLSQSVKAEHIDIPGLNYESGMELKYAECFSVDYYSEDYQLVRIEGGRNYLLIPEGKKVPEGLDPSICVLEKPMDHIYLAAAAVMALFDSLDAVDAIRLSGTQESAWYIENAAAAMRNGEMLFAGKYSEPDYELMINEECKLAIESTMILHSPKVLEMLEAMGIPVFIDYSSYESHPLGRTEWIKLYGALLGKEEEAEAFFDEQAKVIDELKDFENTGKTVAYFYVSSDGAVVVRRPEDYIPKMIEIAGGKYIFDTLDGEASKRSTINMTMEEFYTAAENADYLVYNGAIDDTLTSVEDLLKKDELFGEFRAVKEGNVWHAGKYLYQATDIIANMITDFHIMLTDGDQSALTFMSKIE